MKYHALFVIFEAAVNFETVYCCKLFLVLYGLNLLCFKSVRRKNSASCSKKYVMLYYVIVMIYL